MKIERNKKKPEIRGKYSHIYDALKNKMDEGDSLSLNKAIGSSKRADLYTAEISLRAWASKNGVKISIRFDDDGEKWIWLNAGPGVVRDE